MVVTYLWSDLNDPNYTPASAKFDFHYPSKAAAKAAFKSYTKDSLWGPDNWKPKFQLFKVTVEKVK